jgi:hypothetical protein
MLFIPYP